MTAASSARGRILIADDNTDAAQALHVILELDGFEVVTTSNGQEALTAAETHHPDVLILDIGMPGLTGFQVASEIRTRPLGTSYVLDRTDCLGQPRHARGGEPSRFQLLLGEAV